jgi:hypothetical protein
LAKFANWVICARDDPKLDIFDFHSFARAIWRTVLLSNIIIGIIYGLWIASPPAALTDQIPLQVGGSSAVVLLSILGLVRSTLNGRKDSTR